MPTTITTTTTVYQFDELSERAKENARQWFRETSGSDDWYESTFEDVKACGAMLGITVDKIYFSGFASQGDGACFEGSYKYKSNAADEIAAYTGGSETLGFVAKMLEDIQAKANFALTATVKHSGRYYHAGCTDIDVSYSINDDETTNEDDRDISECLRAFMRWIYRELESAYDDYNSEETVSENIRINEYTFTEEGHRFG